MIAEIAEQIGLIDVRLVSDGNDRGQADVLNRRLADQRQPQRTALRDHGQMARWDIAGDERGVQANPRGIDAEHIRTQNPHFPGAGIRHDFLLFLEISDFGKAGSDDHGVSDALFGALDDGIINPFRGDGNAGQVDRFADVENAAKGVQPDHFSASTVDGIDFPRITPRDDVLQHRMTDLARVPGGADQRDRAGLKKGSDSPAVLTDHSIHP